MEHFAVVQSIIRTGLSGDRDALRKQAARLKSRLKKAGASKEAATIERLLGADTDTKDLEPSRVEVSRHLVHGEVLSADTNPPIDRETGAPLCSIAWPGDSAPVDPVLSKGVDETIAGLLREWAGADKLRALGIEPTRSLLIYGPPGTGKTLTAQHIALSLKVPLIVAKIDGLISSFLGTTARNIGNLFAFANRYRCILLLDEFDAIAKLRDDPQEIGEIKRVVNTLLQNLDERHAFGITIAITNHDRLLDPAVWRRFETQVHLGDPDRTARKAMIERFLHPLKASEADLAVFSYCLEGRSGADIERICNAVKREIALGVGKPKKSALFATLAVLMARSSTPASEPEDMLSRGIEVFISHAANDERLKITQEDLAKVTGKAQSTISRLKKQVPVVSQREAAHA